MAISELRRSFLGLALAIVLALLPVFPHVARAQSPELAMRDFSSGQIKKGVRSLGFGGDGATWGNYALVWKDPGTGWSTMATPLTQMAMTSTSLNYRALMGGV